MATISKVPSATSLSISGTTQVSGTISWSLPTLPNESTIESCVLIGTPTFSMSKGSAVATVNGVTVTNGVQFTIDLGANSATTSVVTTAKGGNKNASGTVTFTNLSYVVTYKEKTTKINNIRMGEGAVQTIYLGTTEIVKVYIGSTLIYGEQ